MEASGLCGEGSFNVSDSVYLMSVGDETLHADGCLAVHAEEFEFLLVFPADSVFLDLVALVRELVLCRRVWLVVNWQM